MSLIKAKMKPEFKIDKSGIKSLGFTVIELLMVVVVLSIIAVSSTSLLFTTLGSSSKASALAIVKQNGDHAVAFIERQARSSKVASCPNPNQLELADEEGETLVFQLNADRVAYTNSRTGVTTFLTSDQIEASAFSCDVVVVDPLQPEVADISFSLSYTPTGARVSENVLAQTFRTRVSVRNYHIE